MKKSKSIFFAFAILVLLPLLMLYQNFNSSITAERNKGSFKLNRSSFSSFKDFSLTETNDDKTKFQINAKNAEIKNRKLGFLRIAFQKVAEMEGVRISFHENNTEITSIVSDYSTLFLGTNNILFTGNVKCSTNKGNTLETKKLFWDSKRKIFKAEDAYTYTDKNGYLRTGKGFESDKRLEIIKIGT